MLSAVPFVLVLVVFLLRLRGLLLVAASRRDDEDRVTA